MCNQLERIVAGALSENLEWWQRQREVAESETKSHIF